jgi:hypothetical protein
VASGFGSMGGEVLKQKEKGVVDWEWMVASFEQNEGQKSSGT